MNSFCSMQQQLADKKVHTFLAALQQQQITSFADNLLFRTPKIHTLFTQSLEVLASPNTLAPDFLVENQAEVIAMSIDGDFILANDETTWIVPKSLTSKDVELFNLPISEFFCRYEQNKIYSNFLVDAP